MGIISPDKIDVFFSYGRNDDRGFGRPVKQFHDALKEKFGPLLCASCDEYPALKRLQDPDPEFFWDETGLPTNGDLSTELLNKVRSSQFLFIFVGNAYLDSKWCFKELEFFLMQLGKTGLNWPSVYSYLFCQEKLERNIGILFWNQTKD